MHLKENTWIENVLTPITKKYTGVIKHVHDQCIPLYVLTLQFVHRHSPLIKCMV